MRYREDIDHDKTTGPQEKSEKKFDHRMEKRKVVKKEDLSTGWGCQEWRDPKSPNKQLSQAHKRVYSRFKGLSKYYLAIRNDDVTVTKYNN